MGAAVAALFLTGFGRFTCNPPDAFTLVDKIYAQEQSNWCWAATGALMMNTIHSASQVTQCDEANRKYGVAAPNGGNGVNCCDHPEHCNLSGDPTYKLYQFDVTTQPMLVAPDLIRKELYCQRKPIAFVHVTVGGRHMMAVVGYGVNENGVPAVLVNDPLPVGKGSRYFVTYQDFSPAAGALTDHQLEKTDYDPRYTGP